MAKIGIDFGTSFCTASWINPSTGQPQVIRFDGHEKIPSMVYFPADGEPMVGWTAFQMIENCRTMEREEEVDEVMTGLMTDLKPMMQRNLSHYLPGGRRLSHEQVMGELFKRIRHEAEEVCFEGRPVDEVVITHPVVFEEWKKEMLKEGARIAGFTSVELLMEPVAAAMGYMSGRERRSQGILVYDFGGGTFDVAYVRFNDEGDYNIPIAPLGDPHCGGADLNLILYQRWEQLARQKCNRTISPDPQILDKPFEAIDCNRQKELMSNEKIEKFKHCVILPPPGFHRLEMPLTHEEWHAMIEPVVNKTIALTRTIVESVGNSGYSIDKAILIGGSSRIPWVYKRLSEVLPITPQRVMDVDVAVALGAILYIPHDLLVAQEVYCLHCGIKISSSNRFCWNCGKPNYRYDKRFDRI